MFQDELQTALRLRSNGNAAGAEVHCRRVLAARADHAPTVHLLGLLRHEQGDHEQALQLLQRSVQIAPGVPDFHSNLAAVLGSLGRHAEAVEAAKQAVHLAPGHVQAHHNLGVAYERQGLLAEAETAYRRTLQIAPDYADAWAHLGNTLRKAGRVGEAEAAYRKALELSPDQAEALSGLGVCFREQGRRSEGMALVERAVRQAPRDDDLRWNWAMALLQQGDWARGFAEYEYRLNKPENASRRWVAPRWDGSDPAGKTVLVHAEQGLGDTIQFARFAPVLAVRGARVVLACQPKLVPLLRTLRGIDAVVPDNRDGIFPPHDFQMPLMSVPHLLGMTTENVPAKVPYLRADPDRTRHWRRELAGIDSFRIGIVWQGNPRFAEDTSRSIPLAQFGALMQIEQVRLVSLQKNPGREQLLEFTHREAVIDFADRLDADDNYAFLDTAAVMTELDLVITSDTAIAHLAGALGVETWIALSFNPNWRWLLDRDDSPWYPTMRLFRQERPGEWEPLFERIAAALRERLAATSRTAAISIGISPGELIDRITILQLKVNHAMDSKIAEHLSRQLDELEVLRDVSIRPSARLEVLSAELAEINQQLWDAKDALRRHEAIGDFGPGFIEQARSIYQNNDRRAALKAAIDRHVGHRNHDPKLYPAY